MSPSNINVGGLKIAVYQNKEHGLPIIFVHGNSLSALTFTHQFSDPALNGFRLIAFDLPGHGNSERSSNPAQDYSPATFIKILIELCHKLNVADAIFVGHSLGGHVALDALDHLPNARGIVTFGTTPLANPPRLDLAFLPNPALNLIFKPELTSQEAQILEAALVSKGTIAPVEISNSIRNVDPLVRHYIGQALTSGSTLDELAILYRRKIPYAIVHGQDDQLVNSQYLMQLPKDLLWHGKIHVEKGAGHSLQIEKPLQFNKVLLTFINEIV